MISDTPLSIMLPVAKVRSFCPCHTFMSHGSSNQVSLVLQAFTPLLTQSSVLCGHMVNLITELAQMKKQTPNIFLQGFTHQFWWGSLHCSKTLREWKTKCQVLTLTIILWTQLNRVWTLGSEQPMAKSWWYLVLACSSSNEDLSVA